MYSKAGATMRPSVTHSTGLRLSHAEASSAAATTGAYHSELSAMTRKITSSPRAQAIEFQLTTSGTPPAAARSFQIRNPSRWLASATTNAPSRTMTTDTTNFHSTVMPPATASDSHNTMPRSLRHASTETSTSN